MKKLFQVGVPSGVKGLLAGLAFASLMFTRASAQLPTLTAAPVPLSWDASPNPTVAGYKVCYGLANQLIPITNRVDTGRTTSALLTGLLPGANYFFFVVAYDNTGFESKPSNVLTYIPPAMSKLSLTKMSNGTMQIKFRAGLGALCQVQYASSLKSPQWQVLTTTTPDLSGNVTVTDPLTGRPSARFYRAVRL